MKLEDKLTTTFYVQTEDQEFKEFLSNKKVDSARLTGSNLLGVEADNEQQLFQWMEEYRNLKTN